MKVIKKPTGAVILFFTILFSICLSAQEYVPSKENLEAREWFQQAKFGLFVHWGVYSLLGDGEWVMNNQESNIINTRISKWLLAFIRKSC
jgi:alpha-L-fucosidase